MRKYDETNRDKEGGIVPKVLVVLLEEIERRMKDVENGDGTLLFITIAGVVRALMVVSVLVQNDANLTSTKLL